MSIAEVAVSATFQDAFERSTPEVRDQRHAWVTRLIERDGPGILRMLWRLLGREADVLDAYQDCFCKLAAFPKPQDLKYAKAYAYKAASNIAIELIRSRKRRAVHWEAVVAEKGGPACETAPPEVASPANSGRLREAIAELPTHLRQVVLLRDLAQRPYEEVGRMLGIDPATARVYRRHAVVKLAELMGVGGGRS